MTCKTTNNIGEQRGLNSLWMRLYPYYTACSGSKDMYEDSINLDLSCRVQPKGYLWGHTPRETALTLVHMAKRSLTPLMKRILIVKTSTDVKRINPSLKYNSGSELDSHHSFLIRMQAGGLYWYRSTIINFKSCFWKQGAYVKSVNAESYGFLTSVRERLAKVVTRHEKLSNTAKKPQNRKKNYQMKIYVL